MDENGKTCGQTAMERLCREMAECVVELLPAAWCRNHGINDGAPWSQCKGIARADIERRISEAREEDESAGAVSIKREWRDKAAELDGLREAGRIAPEGLSWFCYEDGAPLLLGAEAWDSAGHRLRVVALSHKGRAAVRPWERGEGLSWFCYEDGAPLLLGAEAWDSAGHRLRVVALSHKGRAAVRPWERGDGKGWFCYEDGAPLLLGAEAWDSAGHRLRVVALSHKGRAAVRPWERGDGKAAREAVRDHAVNERCEPEARWWRCPECGAGYVMERGVRPLHCPMCGVRYVWPEFQVRAEEGEE